MQDTAQTLVQTSCGHRFHGHCIARWLVSPVNYGGSCPCCRARVVPPFRRRAGRVGLLALDEDDDALDLATTAAAAPTAVADAAADATPPHAAAYASHPFAATSVTTAPLPLAPDAVPPPAAAPPLPLVAAVALPSVAATTAGAPRLSATAAPLHAAPLTPAPAPPPALASGPGPSPPPAAAPSHPSSAPAPLPPVSSAPAVPRPAAAGWGSDSAAPGGGLSRSRSRSPPAARAPPADYMDTAWNEGASSAPSAAERPLTIFGRPVPPRPALPLLQALGPDPPGNSPGVPLFTMPFSPLWDPRAAPPARSHPSSARPPSPSPSSRSPGSRADRPGRWNNNPVADEDPAPPPLRRSQRTQQTPQPYWDASLPSPEPRGRRPPPASGAASPPGGGR